MMNRKRIYPSLKRWRSENRLTQREAAAQFGIGQPFYSRLERGLQIPHPRLAKHISDLAGVPLESVLGIAS
jgi:transcriptional regulator with XRE-family HTH domain